MTKPWSSGIYPRDARILQCQKINHHINWRIKTIWSSQEMQKKFLIKFNIHFSCSVMSDSLWSHGLQHARPPCPSPTPRVYSNSCPLSQWCHPTLSSSVIPFSSCPQSFPAWRSFPMSQLFLSGGQSIGLSASTSVCPLNTRTDLL